jgi:S-adenosylmethionine/arginine decarboxylase-like enzyme
VNGSRRSISKPTRAESHIAVHTWPEYGYAAVDIFTCNLDADLGAGIDALARYLLPGRIVTRELTRGEQPVAISV